MDPKDPYFIRDAGLDATGYRGTCDASTRPVKMLGWNNWSNEHDVRILSPFARLLVVLRAKWLWPSIITHGCTQRQLNSRCCVKSSFEICFQRHVDCAPTPDLNRSVFRVVVRRRSCLEIARLNDFLFLGFVNGKNVWPFEGNGGPHLRRST